MKKYIISFLILIYSFNLDAKEIKTFEDFNNMLKETKKILPQNINSKMVLLKLNYKKEEKKLEYVISFTELSSEELDMADLKSLLKESLIDNICPNKTTLNLKKLGIILRYLYYDKYGEYYYGEELNNKFCINKK